MSNIAVVDVEMFKGITRELNLQLETVDDDGVHTGYVSLTGKVVAVIFTTIFSSTLTLLSSDPANANGSECVVTAAITGEFRWKLTAAELSAPVAADGTWRVELREGLDADLMLRGSIRVIPFVPGGSI